MKKQFLIARNSRRGSSVLALSSLYRYDDHHEDDGSDHDHEEADDHEGASLLVNSLANSCADDC